MSRSLRPLLRGALAATVLLLALPACGPKEASPGASTTDGAATEAGARRNATVHDLKAALETGGISLFDVRSRSEYFAAHVAEATLMPLAELQNAGRRTELEAVKGDEIWIICQSGGRSSAAADLLVGEGYTVVNVSGGTGAWIAAGYPVE